MDRVSDHETASFARPTLKPSGCDALGDFVLHLEFPLLLGLQDVFPLTGSALLSGSSEPARRWLPQCGPSHPHLPPTRWKQHVYLLFVCLRMIGMLPLQATAYEKKATTTLILGLIGLRLGLRGRTFNLASSSPGNIRLADGKYMQLQYMRTRFVLAQRGLHWTSQLSLWLGHMAHVMPEQHAVYIWILIYI